MTIISNKNQIRGNLLKKRNSFLGAHNANAIIISRFYEVIMPLLRHNSIIAAYYPTGSEVDILALLNGLSRQNFAITLPVINLNRLIDFYLWRPGDELIPSNITNNIIEPKQRDLAIIPTIMLIPLIACDFQGNRIGSGKGMYDQYIHKLTMLQCKPLCIGIAYDFQLLESITPDEYDQRLDIILTDKHYINHLKS